MVTRLNSFEHTFFFICVPQAIFVELDANKGNDKRTAGGLSKKMRGYLKKAQQNLARAASF